MKIPYESECYWPPTQAERIAGFILAVFFTGLVAVIVNVVWLVIK